ncbi:MAG TPA: DUF1127 domain-containing protein [Saliniramus sp.]|nr:DUF1127 domain-containing protein [Saliniramus sp.]
MARRGLGAIRASPLPMHRTSLHGSQFKEPVISGKIFFKANSELRNSASWKIAARLVASTILDVVGAAFRAIVNRSSVTTLAAWDDRMLKDIGLTRGDVDGALSQPWHRDPSRELMVRRVENRVRRRPAAVEAKGVSGDQGSEVAARENCH